MIHESLAQLIEIDARGFGGVREERDLGQPRHRVDLQHPRVVMRVDDDVDPRHAGAAELEESASSDIRGHQLGAL
jgi:hypothetical protein